MFSYQWMQGNKVAAGDPPSACNALGSEQAAGLQIPAHLDYFYLEYMICYILSYLPGHD